MAEERVQRRLAAILAADVVGYSRLIERDETGTLAILKQRRTGILVPLVTEHHGRIVKVMGDGVLVEFGSAVSAVSCAVALQNKMAAANDGIDDDRCINLRIGINLGDVVVDAGDLYGDGVIIAVRLQAMADAGGIYVSGSVHEQIGSKLPLAFEDLGSREVKNATKPVRVFRVRTEEVGRTANLRPEHTKPAIAVLPFANMSGDPEQQYYSDGITEDIITELSRFRSLFVIARNSSFQYRDKATDVRRIGRELGAQYVVEGSIRKAGDRLRITAQLIEAASGNHLWAERYDRDLKDVFAVQDQIIGTIVGTLVGRLQAAGTEQASRKPPKSLAAYECVLRGKALPLGDLETEAERRRMFERAIELDPKYGQAYALQAHSVFLEWFRDMTGSDIGLDRAFRLAKKAVALDEFDSTCQFSMGWIYLFRRSFDLAEEHFRRALELNPNNPEQVVRMGSLYYFLSKPDEAMGWLKQAKLLDPYIDSYAYWDVLGCIHFMVHRYDDAIVAFSRAPTMSFWAQAYLAACNALVDRMEPAQESAAEVLRLKPDFSLNRFAEKEPYKSPTDRQYLISSLRKARLPE